MGQLIESIRRNDYPAELVDIFVVADNCTDQTAALARSLGCIVYERNDPEKVGKGFALHYLFEHLHADPLYAERCDAYVVLDADNILTKTYLTEMNKVFDRGYDMVTSYRNSKNFGENWIAERVRLLVFARILSLKQRQNDARKQLCDIGDGVSDRA